MLVERLTIAVIIRAARASQTSGPAVEGWDALLNIACFGIFLPLVLRTSQDDFPWALSLVLLCLTVRDWQSYSASPSITPLVKPEMRLSHHYDITCNTGARPTLLTHFTRLPFVVSTTFFIIEVFLDLSRSLTLLVGARSVYTFVQLREAPVPPFLSSNSILKSTCCSHCFFRSQ